MPNGMSQLINFDTVFLNHNLHNFVTYRQE